jgi:hypothetical protein
MRDPAPPVASRGASRLRVSWMIFPLMPGHVRDVDPKRYDATDIRATLLVGYSAVRPSATAINGAPSALSMGTALRQEQSGGEDGRDSECSKHVFISLVGHAVTPCREW